MNTLTKLPGCLQKFMKTFNTEFSKPLMLTMTFYVAGLLMGLKRFNCQTLAQITPGKGHQAYQYLLSEADWDPDKVNQLRLQKLMNSRSGKLSGNGSLIIDDTGNPKKYSSKIWAVGTQKIGTERYPVKAHVNVFAAWVHGDQQVAVDFRTYIPKGWSDSGKVKSKLDLMLEVVDTAVQQKIPFREIIFDAWYLSLKHVEALEAKGLKWMGDCKSNRKLIYKGKERKAGDLVTVLPTKDFKEYYLKNADNESVKIKATTVRLWASGLKGKRTALVVLGKCFKDDEKDVRIILTNHENLSVKTLIKRWSHRWGIEVMFRNMKQFCSYEGYQCRSEKALRHHWMLVIMAHTFIYWCDCHAVFRKHANLKTFGDFQRAFKAIVDCQSIKAIAKNPDYFMNFANSRVDWAA